MGRVLVHVLQLICLAGTPQNSVYKLNLYSFERVAQWHILYVHDCSKRGVKGAASVSYVLYS